MERTDHPGLRNEPTLFEMAYRTDDGDVARVRFVPQNIENSLESQTNIALVPTQLCVHVSASLVDDEGQVLKVAGRGLLLDAQSHSWSFHGDGEFDQEAWLDGIAKLEVERLTKAARTLRSAARLLAPVSSPSS